MLERVCKSYSRAALIEEIKKHDIISFDIFDTLILRPFQNPTDMFMVLGNKFGVMNFKNIGFMIISKSRLCLREKMINILLN